MLSAAFALLFAAGCKSSAPASDGMMSGKDGGTCTAKKDDCGATEVKAAKKDDCCASEAKTAKKDDCCASEAKATDAKATKKFGCCAEGETKAEAKVKAGCCKGQAVSTACADCKKACEAAGGCDTGKKCDEKPCDEKPKP
ncbi:MAG TPA: hypothetical protein VFS19_00540 [Planctomycetota bacterium]|nr:hypothetical protein [Planctomycetota bacterium]